MNGEIARAVDVVIAAKCKRMTAERHTSEALKAYTTAQREQNDAVANERAAEDALQYAVHKRAKRAWQQNHD